MTMHLSAHTWMRCESLELILDRPSRFGYSSIELAGESELFPIPETLRLLDKYGFKCWGTVTIQQSSRDLTAKDAKQRRDTIQYMKNIIAMSAALGGQIVTVVPGRVGKVAATSAPEDE